MLVVLGMSSTAHADDTWFHSVVGPGPGRVRGTAGFGFLVLDGPFAGIGPTGGVGIGLGEVVDFKVDMSIAVIPANHMFAAGQIRPTFVFRPLGDREAFANIGLKIGPEILFAGGRRREDGIFGLTPGFAVSTGTQVFQFTADVDFPIYLKAAGDFNALPVEPGIRPAVTFEGAVSSSVSLYVRLAPTISWEKSGLFFTHTMGVTF